ncbi:hypothetical protein CK203_114908 [Vitis vinifera]|uniref:Uncharacterized protein n=1 Tax=Vitis vinifera TaxID=29760 RepID=A0A438C456_VITVI|nr:hypothetical protein CK203_114908 [Vitis vinifera]
MSVANIGKLQEKFHSKKAAKFRSKRTTFSQPKADFAAVQNLPSAWSDWFPMVITTKNFSKYGCYVMALMQSHGNFSHPEVISYELLEGEVFNSKFCINPLKPISMAIERFLFAFPPCIPDLLMAKDFKTSVLHVSELSIALPWIPKNSPQSRIALTSKGDKQNPVECIEENIGMSKKKMGRRVARSLMGLLDTSRRPKEATPFVLDYGMKVIISTEIGMPTVKIAMQDQMDNDEEIIKQLDWADKK